MGGGKGGDAPTPTPSPYETSMANIANQLYSSTTPMRQGIMTQLGQFVNGGQPVFDAAAYLRQNPDVAANGMDPWQHYQQYGQNEGRALPMTPGMTSGQLPSMLDPVYQSGRRQYEDQYGTAKENILSSVAPGGAQTTALAGLERSRANAIGDLQSNIAQDLYNKAYGVATAAPSQAGSILGNAANTYSNMQSQMYNSNNASSSAMGMGLMSFLGGGTASKLGGKAGSALSGKGGAGAAASTAPYVADFASVLPYARLLG